MASNNEWWDNSSNKFVTDMMEHSTEEYGSQMIYKDFVANITGANLNALKNELRSLDLTVDTKPSNIITVSGLDEAVLDGQQLLDALQRYDRNARYYD